MAFDGITTAAVVHELNTKLAGGGISRIVQSEKDELILTVKSNKVTYRVLLSASASLPLIYITPFNKQAPLAAPNFCMLLRKHLQGGQILRVHQPSLERVIQFDVQHRDELGDLCVRRLIIELMGKHSNIILTDEGGKIIDSIKRIPSQVSSVREVLPGRAYFIPGADAKRNPLTAERADFGDVLKESPYDLVKALYMSFTGLSPIASEELVYEAGLEARKKASDLDSEEVDALFGVFEKLTG
ncbi:MAG: NFACT family protein, partial [Lachnospiraceae bacterium]|nr:NFACT family protein [Lachnospiraceae bacterium]